MLEKGLRVFGCHLEKSSHNEIWVIGNGESRKNFNLNSLESFAIGCNAIHREYVCNEIVAVDRRMVREIVANPKYKNIKTYTRPNWVKEFSHNSNVTIVPELPYKGNLREDDPWHWNSGPFALLIACLKSPTTINLLGFDLYSPNHCLNNVYKDTDNYGKSTDHAIDHRYWVHQLYMLCTSFPKINFIQWQNKNWQIPSSWLSINNLTFKTINV